MMFTLVCEREDNGCWLVWGSQLPGFPVYGSSVNRAMAKPEVLNLRVLDERLERGEAKPQAIGVSVPAAASAHGLLSGPSAFCLHPSQARLAG